MIDTHFKSEQNQFLHLDTEKILSAPLYILLGYASKDLNIKFRQVRFTAFQFSKKKYLQSVFKTASKFFS